MRGCPFCEFDEGWTRQSSEKPIKYRVICFVCGAMGPEAKTTELAEKMWEGLLIDLPDNKVKELLKEDAMGGVSAPMATVNNVPGVGNATPGSAATNNIGSGDKWGGIGKRKKKKKKVNEGIIKLEGIRYNVERVEGDRIFITPLYNPYGGPRHDSPMSTPGFWININDKRIEKLEENNLNPYDKIGASIAKKMGVKQPFKKKDSKTNTVTQVTEKYTIPTLDNYLNEGDNENISIPDELKDVSAKDKLLKLDIPFIFKPGPSGKNRAYIKGDINDVVKKLVDLGWEQRGKNSENTIKKFHKDDDEIAIFADGKDLPRITLKPIQKTEVAESIIIKKLVSNSLEPYIKNI